MGGAASLGAVGGAVGGAVAPAECCSVHTDFFAVRPEHIERQAFADWKIQGNAERQATRAFQNITSSAERAVWLVMYNRDGQCRVRGGGLWHSQLACEELMQQQPWLADR